MEKTSLALTRQLGHYLFHENSEIVLETARVLGNLTRREQVVSCLVQQRLHRALLLLLQHAQTDVVSAVLGVLVNISSHSMGRSALLQALPNQQPLVEEVSGLLRRLSLAQLSTLGLLSCQLLYNLLTSSELKQMGLNYPVHQLSETLDIWIDTAQEVAENKVSLENFLQVAQALLRFLIG